MKIVSGLLDGNLGEIKSVDIGDGLSLHGVCYQSLRDLLGFLGASAHEDKVKAEFGEDYSDIWVGDVELAEFLEKRNLINDPSILAVFLGFNEENEYYVALKLVTECAKKRTTKFYQRLSACLSALKTCIENNVSEFIDSWSEEIEKLVNEMPHGSGFDSPITLNNESTPEKLIFDGSFHCMDENGFYAGWLDFTAIVEPSLQYGFTLDVKIMDKTVVPEEIDTDLLLEYINDSICEVLNKEV
jgi:hypothetical protein